MSNAEQRDFRISNNMIYHLVFSQAGSVAKSLTELVMNSQDAGADVFSLQIDADGFRASDNGRGFKTRQEIESWFEELGFDHSDELHQQDGRFSRFGLGRAQCMAFAKTDWFTNTFVMSVDIKARGISYELKTDQPMVAGCTIEGVWYEPMSFADLKDTLRELEELIAYAAISVEINGNIVNKKKVKWDYETDKVFVKRRETGGLAVYNQGVLVRSYAAHQYGSGVVVSKVPLTLNIARNDILMSACPVWKEVRTFLRADAVNSSKKKTTLSDNERQLLIDRLLAGEVLFDELKASPLLEDVTGRKWPIERIIDKKLTVHTSGPKLAADRVHQSKQAFVLAKKMLESFSVDTPEALAASLERLINSGSRPVWMAPAKVKYVPIETLIASNNEHYVLLSDKELTKVEKVALGALNKGLGHLHSAVNYARGSDRRTPRRTLYIGVSESAQAWTDGSSFVAINREFLREHVRDGFRGFTTITNVLVHELCHEQNTATGHQHGSEFYEAFHDVLCGSQSLGYGTAIRLTMAHFVSKAQKEGLKLTRNEARDVDREVSIEREILGETAFIDAIKSATLDEPDSARHC